MADNTNIEWADATTSDCCRPARGKHTYMRQVEPTEKLLDRGNAAFLDPFPNVPRSLAAVAWPAGGNDVGGLGQAAMFYGDNMVHDSCRLPTVGALSAKLFQKHFTHGARHNADASSPHFGTSPRIFSTCFRARISAAFFNIFTRSTYTSADGLRRQPPLTTPAPGQSSQSHGLPLRPASAGSLPIVLTGATDIGVAIKSAGVTVIRRQRQALSALFTDLEAIFALQIATVGHSLILGGGHG